MDNTGHPTAPLYLVRDAMRLRSDQRYGEAVPLLEQALASATGRPGLQSLCLTIMTDCLIALGRAELAEPHLRRAISVTLADWSDGQECLLGLRQVLGRVLCVLGRTTEAAVVFSAEHGRELARFQFEMEAAMDLDHPESDDLEERQIN